MASLWPSNTLLQEVVCISGPCCPALDTMRHRAGYGWLSCTGQLHLFLKPGRGEKDLEHPAVSIQSPAQTPHCILCQTHTCESTGNSWHSQIHVGTGIPGTGSESQGTLWPTLQNAQHECATTSLLAPPGQTVHCVPVYFSCLVVWNSRQGNGAFP